MSALGKRPASWDDGDGGPRKTRRLESADALLGELQSLASSVASLPHSLSKGQEERLDGIMSLLRQVKYVNVAERKRLSERPVEESILPADLLELVMRSMAPSVMAKAQCTCRAFDSAVRAAILARITSTGFPRADRTKRCTSLLDSLESQATRAPALVARFSNSDILLLDGFHACILEQYVEPIGAKIHSDDRRTAFGAWQLLGKMAKAGNKEILAWARAHASEVVAFLAGLAATPDSRPGLAALMAAHVYAVLPHEMILSHFAELSIALRVPDDSERSLAIVVHALLSMLSSSMPSSMLPRLPRLRELLLPYASLRDHPRLSHSHLSTIAIRVLQRL